LRSSWEYGYAKFLNDNRIEWDVEARSYLLSDGRYYRPDFFIYENNNLSKIVEIKSRWSNGSLERIDKFEMFKKEYGDISAELISDELFLLINRKQKDIINEWKKVRLMELKND
jgi:predicted nuclease of restriction endonuclease-like RecB superfamily